MFDEQGVMGFAKFEILFKKSYKELSSVAYNYLEDEEESKDVVQEVFIKVWEKRKDLIDDPQAIFYLVAAVKNNCISKLRKKMQHLSVDDVMVRNTLKEDVSKDSDSEEELDVYQFVNKALEELPPKCLVVFKLSRFDLLTYAQIAERLGISIKTVENQMGKAIKIMRSYIKENPLPPFLLVLVEVLAFLYKGQ
ncbi:RNA polymerase ECF-type sigma factor [Tenacibaculum maritimum]|uniref:RNA polymerase sigma-70 factor n=1 Tax=Tenacibaculum maritimum TaxID=107401 RepID=UPI0012E53516|nr:RNA polymerase sigma-70 factor [Tenacibaculum maritimum]CAA0150929.1 RNA polymerase ECF-type sigma factor [Tenacibaculum maritimum]CAA0194378.1 RNA polymerase ECF-type sigma factor [Tenacibaculum maritimum]CAA0218254.1 RNA polymerase ECF-type sigma factor [Tenacibaculum maritimum]